MQARVAVEQRLAIYVARFALHTLDSVVEASALVRGERAPFNSHSGVGTLLTFGGDRQDGGGKRKKYGQEPH